MASWVEITTAVKLFYLYSHDVGNTSVFIQKCPHNSANKVMSRDFYIIRLGRFFLNTGRTL